MAPFSIPTFWRGANTLEQDANPTNTNSPESVGEKVGSHELKNGDGVIKNEEHIPSEFQTGVQKVEATTIVWSNWHMIAAYVL
jgi:hypothetical protein